MEVFAKFESIFDVVKSQHQQLSEKITELETENQTLKSDASEDSSYIRKLLRDNHRKQAHIDTLERQLARLQSECHRLGEKHTASSPVQHNGPPLQALEHSNESRGSDLGSSPTTKSYTSKREALRETSANKRTKKRKRLDDPGSKAIGAVAEDGDDTATLDIEPPIQGATKVTGETSPFNHRLEQLLENGTPSRALLSFRSQQYAIVKQAPMSSNNSVHVAEPTQAQTTHKSINVPPDYDILLRK